MSGQLADSLRRRVIDGDLQAAAIVRILLQRTKASPASQDVLANLDRSLRAIAGEDVEPLEPKEATVLIDSLVQFVSQRPPNYAAVVALTGAYDERCVK